MRLSVSTIAVAILCAVSSVSSAATGKPRMSGIEITLSRATDLSIDLAQIPAWEPVEALGLVPIETGPGLPTLKELNKTWADLVKPVPIRTENSDVKEKRQTFSPYCTTWNIINEDYAVYCWNYLNDLGSTSCVVPGPEIRFCGTGASGSYYGRTQSGSLDSTTCQNVAAGANWIHSNCRKIDWFGYPSMTEGRNAAWGNGNIIVNIR